MFAGIFLFFLQNEPKFFQTAGCFPVSKKFKASKKRYCAYKKRKKFNFAVYAAAIKKNNLSGVFSARYRTKKLIMEE